MSGYGFKVGLEKKSLFVQRLLVLTAIEFFLFLILIGRLYYLQIIKSEHYQTLSDENRIHLQMTLPLRGKILDRNGYVSAENALQYNAVLLRQNVKDTPGVLRSIQRILNLEESALKRVLKELKVKPRHVPVILKKNLSWDEVAALELNSLALAGVAVEVGSKRFYPLKDIGTHVIGYVSSPAVEDVEIDPSLILPGAQTGKQGIEKQYDADLKGAYGQKEVEVNAQGKAVRTLEEEIPTPGQDLKLTIDHRLQQYALDQFKDHKSGAAIVMNIQTGEVLCLVSVPSYDPNLFVSGIDIQNWKELNESIYRPMTNKALAGLYSPGSAFKIIVALAALESGLISSEEIIYCNHYITVGNHRFHCWKKGGHGGLNLVKALLKSCDVYFYEVARRLGPKPIINMAKKLGLGELTDIDLPGEKAGLVSSPEWKRQRKNEGWYAGDTMNLAIGQGSMLVTPLQLVCLIAQIANGGKKIRPHVKQQSSHPNHQELLNISEKNLKLVLEGLIQAINSPEGTAYAMRIPIRGQEMGGKTSTSQVRRISMQERKTGIRQGASLPWQFRDNALFVGFAPIDQPRYAVVALVEHGGWGGLAAAPIGRNLLMEIQRYDALAAQNQGVNDNELAS
jgi:penicillin-binding protein 2